MPCTRLHGERHAAEIGQVLAHGEVAVHLVLGPALRVDVHVLLRLLLHELRLRFEQLCVLLLPIAHAKYRVTKPSESNLTQ